MLKSKVKSAYFRQNEFSLYCCLLLGKLPRGKTFFNSSLKRVIRTHLTKREQNNKLSSMESEWDFFIKECSQNVVPL